MVCICTTAEKLSSDFFKKIFQRLCRGQKHLKITPSRKPRCPSPSIRGTFLLFPFSTLLLGDCLVPPPIFERPLAPRAVIFLCAFEATSEHLDFLYRHRSRLYNW